jgi:hypothetical protein
MRRDARAYLTDARDAAALIRQFVQGKTPNRFIGRAL